MSIPTILEKIIQRKEEEVAQRQSQVSLAQLQQQQQLMKQLAEQVAVAYRERDAALNRSLLSALQPIADAAIALGRSQKEAGKIQAALFAHASGLLLLDHTGRIGLFSFSLNKLITHLVKYFG